MALVQAVEPFTAYIDGVAHAVTADEVVDDADPVVAGREHLFRALVPSEASRARTALAAPKRGRKVEQATAAPGEVRDLSLPQ